MTDAQADDGLVAAARRPCRKERSRVVVATHLLERIATFPLGNAAPRNCTCKFPAYSSSTALSVVLTPVLPLHRKPFANVTSLIRLITEAKGAEP
jgi:hypothetical protein